MDEDNIAEAINGIEIVKGRPFEVGPRYKNLKYLGNGAYGVVASANDAIAGGKVAIKKVTPFDHQIMCQRTLREIQILMHFNHDNIINVLDILCIDDIERLTDIYLIQTLMEIDMDRLLRSQIITCDHACYFIYQILRALKYIHSANVLHRDLKPSNLLLNSTCDLKICDFGLARVAEPGVDHSGFLTEYVATRWYRAPEVMLSSKSYTKAMDMWSVGCIFAEMLDQTPPGKHKAIFAGKHYLDQLERIFSIIGTPTKSDMECVLNPKAQSYLCSLPKKEPRPFRQIYPSAHQHAINLLENLLTFNPDARFTAEQALGHAYVKLYACPEDEPICEAPLTSDINFESTSTQALKEQVFRECIRFKQSHSAH